MLGFGAERLACFRGLGFKVGFRPLSIHATRGGGQFRPVLDCPSDDVRSGNVEKRDIQGDCLMTMGGEILREIYAIEFRSGKLGRKTK
jgi:hypothetical protein